MSVNFNPGAQGAQKSHGPHHKHGHHHKKHHGHHGGVNAQAANPNSQAQPTAQQGLSVLA